MTAERTDSKSLFVTRPNLPPLQELLPLLEEIWASRILTNFGPIHQRFEQALCDHLGVKHVSLVANATLGLMLATRLLKLQGEVITTPFSFIATGHALLWGGVTPVFVDIDAETLNIDPAAIERAITSHTTAIMAVHCYGKPCDVEAIEAIARRHKLKVIYDAAHAFGIEHSGRSVLLNGDASVLSFHATKVFNTFEGGAVVLPDEQSKLHMDRLINYGIVDEVTIESAGFNAKMNEFNAAVGLVQLRHVDAYIAARKLVDRRYRELLAGVPDVHCLHRDGVQPENYYSFPILVRPDHGRSRDALHTKLRTHGIFARRYFYPALADLPTLEKYSRNRLALTETRRAADQILCLPLYPALTEAEQIRIAKIIRND